MAADTPVYGTVAINQEAMALDDDIKNIRAQIKDLTKRRKLMSATLLASTNARLLPSKRPLDLAQKDEIPILAKSQKHRQSNLHRLTFSTTSFPFKDPSASPDAPKLLGIRIDICDRSGKFKKPYYLLLKKQKLDGTALIIYRHTIPPFIPLKVLAQRYLTTRDDDDEDSDDPKVPKPSKQNLPRLVRKLRQYLVSWHLRQEAIDLMRDELHLATRSEVMVQADGDSTSSRDGESHGSFGVANLEPTAPEARFIRVEWADGRVGQIKLSDNGGVEKAVIYGDGRERDAERILTGGSGNIDDLIERVKILAVDGA